MVRQTYDRNEDTFREWFLIAPCLLLAILIPQKRTPTEVIPEAFEPVLWGFHMRQACGTMLGSAPMPANRNQHARLSRVAACADP